MNFKLKKLVVYSLIMSILLCLPVYAADEEEDIMVIDYEDIVDMVLENNLNLEIAKYSIENLEDDWDKEREAIRDGTGLPTITNGQMSSSRLSRDQVEQTQIYTAKNYFIGLHQLSNNIEQAEIRKIIMEDQLQINEAKYGLGLLTESVVNDFKTSIKESDTTYNTLVSSRDSSEIQFKNILDISSSKEIKLGEVPDVSKDYIDAIDLEDDINLAVDNSISLKIQKQNQMNSRENSKIRSKENKLTKKDIELSMLNQYNLILEKYNNLENSKSVLENLENEFAITGFKYLVGLISLNDFNTAERELELQKLTVQANEISLFKEVENYEAMKDGMV